MRAYNDERSNLIGNNQEKAPTMVGAEIRWIRCNKASRRSRA